MILEQQIKFALKLLEWHGGQYSAVYAVGSCMLSDAQRGVAYTPANHRGHAGTAEETGALRRACFELRALKRDANFPECVTPAMERECNALADKLTALFPEPVPPAPEGVLTVE